MQIGNHTEERYYVTPYPEALAWLRWIAWIKGLTLKIRTSTSVTLKGTILQRLFMTNGVNLCGKTTPLTLIRFCVVGQIKTVGISQQDMIRQRWAQVGSKRPAGSARTPQNQRSKYFLKSVWGLKCRFSNGTNFPGYTLLYRQNFGRV